MQLKFSKFLDHRFLQKEWQLRRDAYHNIYWFCGTWYFSEISLFFCEEYKKMYMFQQFFCDQSLSAWQNIFTIPNFINSQYKMSGFLWQLTAAAHLLFKLRFLIKYLLIICLVSPCALPQQRSLLIIKTVMLTFRLGLLFLRFSV